MLNLEVLDLSYNWLSGEVPSALGDLANLRELYLSDNRLSGEIQSTLGNLAALEVLVLSNNHLSGSIPHALGNLTKPEHPESLGQPVGRGNTARTRPPRQFARAVPLGEPVEWRDSCRARRAHQPGVAAPCVQSVGRLCARVGGRRSPQRLPGALACLSAPALRIGKCWSCSTRLRTARTGTTTKTG